jgi:hypothetical protein
VRVCVCVFFFYNELDTSNNVQVELHPKAIVNKRCEVHESGLLETPLTTERRERERAVKVDGLFMDIQKKKKKAPT